MAITFNSIFITEFTSSANNIRHVLVQGEQTIQRPSPANVNEGPKTGHNADWPFRCDDNEHNFNGN